MDPLKKKKKTLRNKVETNRGKFSVCFYHVIYMFRVSRYSVIAWKPKNSLLETGGISAI